MEAQGKKRRLRPKIRWWDSVRAAVRENGLSREGMHISHKFEKS